MDSAVPFADSHSQRAPLRTGTALAMLAAAMLLATAVVAAIAYERAGVPGIVGSIVAGCVCAGGAAAALLLTAHFTGTPQALAGVLGGTLLRTMVPLASAVAVSQFSPTLARAGVFGQFVILFLVALAVETYLSVAIVNASSRDSRPAKSSNDTR
jgi:hypothetical protein